MFFLYLFVLVETMQLIRLVYLCRIAFIKFYELQKVSNSTTGTTISRKWPSDSRKRKKTFNFQSVLFIDTNETSGSSGSFHYKKAVMIIDGNEILFLNHQIIIPTGSPVSDFCF